MTCKVRTSLMVSACMALSISSFALQAQVEIPENARTIANPGSDATIHVVSDQLSFVSPPISYKPAGEVYRWRITPPGQYTLRVCIKAGSANPFIDPKWADRCEEDTSEINGTLTSTPEIVPGQDYGEYEYNIYDPVNNLLIDPIIRVN